MARSSAHQCFPRLSARQLGALCFIATTTTTTGNPPTRRQLERHLAEAAGLTPDTRRGGQADQVLVSLEARGLLEPGRVGAVSPPTPTGWATARAQVAQGEPAAAAPAAQARRAG